MTWRTRVRTVADRIRTEPGLKKDVVVLTTLVVLALGAGGWILGNQRFTAPWTDRFEVAAEFEAVPGIAPGNGQEVRINGVIVGQIVDAEVNDAGRAQVRMELEPGHEVFEDATFVLRPKSPLNEMYVTIDPGTPATGEVASGTVFGVAATQRPVQVDEVLEHLDTDTRASLAVLLEEADVALANAGTALPGGLDEAADVVGDLQPVVAQLDQRRDSLQRLVTAVGLISTAVGENDERLVSLAAGLESTLGVLAGSSGDLDATLAALPGLTDDLDAATVAVDALVTQLDPTLESVREATDVLAPAMDRVAETADLLGTTVERAQPVVDLARPVVGDLRPVAAELRVALPALRSTTERLDPVTATLLPYLPDLGAFMVNTRSLTSLRDANGGILRGMLMFNTTSLPSEALGSLSPDQVVSPR